MQRVRLNLTVLLNKPQLHFTTINVELGVERSPHKSSKECVCVCVCVCVLVDLTVHSCVCEYEVCVSVRKARM